MAINAISGLTLNFRNSVDGAEKASAKDMLRLSTGLRINSAADDAAGLAISTRMNAQSRGMAMAIRNANDLLSLTQTAEGAAKDINDALQRMRELSVQAANGTLTAADRTSINEEVTQLKQHIDVVSKQTKFNNINLLDGSIKNTSFQIGGNTQDTLKLSMPALDTNSLAQTAVTNKYKLTFTALAAGQSVTVAGLTFKATADTSADDVAAAFSNLEENATTGSGAATGEYSGTFTGFSSGKTDGTVLELTTTPTNAKGEAPNVSVAQIDAIVTNSYKLTFSGLLTGQAVTVAGLTYTATSDSTAADVASAFAGLTEGATTGSGTAGTYSGTFTGFSTANASNGVLDITSDAQNPTGASPSVSVTQLANPRTTSTYNVQFSDLIAGQSVTVAGLTYTATSDETASSVASAFANLNEGATSGSGSGTYTGSLIYYDTKTTNRDNLTLVSSSSNVLGSRPQISVSGAASPTIPAVSTTQGATNVQGVTGVYYQDDYFIPSTPAAGDSITINGLTATFNANINAGYGIQTNVMQILNFWTNGTTISPGMSAWPYTGVGADFSGTFSGDYTTSGQLGTYNGINGVYLSIQSTNYTIPKSPISVSTTMQGGLIHRGETQQVLPISAITGQTETSIVDFNNYSLKRGEAITIDGFTFTASQDTPTNELLNLFYQASNHLSYSSSYGSTSGVFSNFTSSGGGGFANKLIFISNTPTANVSDIQISTRGVPAPNIPSSIRISSVLQVQAVRPTVANSDSTTTVPASEPSVAKETSTAHELPQNLNAITVATEQDASDAIQVIDTSINAVSKFQAELGAVENRVESVINNLTTANTNLKASISRIDDADYALETSNMAKHQIISQAAMAMLTQANQSTATVESLLKQFK